MMLRFVMRILLSPGAVMAINAVILVLMIMVAYDALHGLMTMTDLTEPMEVIEDIGVIMIGFASASQYYLQEIAFTGAVILIGSFLVGLIMIGWSAVRGKNQDQAIKEIVELIEILKETMTDDEKERIFGRDGLASRVQSELTTKIINKVREKNGFLRLKEIKDSRVDAEPPEGDM